MVSSNMGGNDTITKIGKYVSLLCAVLMLLTGIVHVFSEFDAWCFDIDYVRIDGRDPDADRPMKDKCFGPWLRWSVENAKWTDDFNKHGYRDVFTFAPSKLVSNWTPTIFGFVALSNHFDGARTERISSSWMRQFLFHVFAAFFGTFGFAGGWGVLCGFIICPFGCAVFLMCQFLRPSADTTCGIAFGARSENDGQFADAGADAYHAQTDKGQAASNDAGSYANASTVY